MGTIVAIFNNGLIIKIVAFQNLNRPPSGLEEDFKSWKEGFAKDVFPVLLGKVAMTQLTTSSRLPSGGSGKPGSCECGGGQRKEDCCKENTEASTTEQV